MEIEGHVERRDHAPEGPVLRQIVVQRALSELGEAVDQRALEAEILDAALELAARQVRVLERQRGEALEALRAARDLLGEEVVGAARDLARLPGLGNRLHRRRVERQDHHLHAVRVHLT